MNRGHMGAVRKVPNLSRNISLCLSLGFCALGILHVTTSTRYGWSSLRIDLKFYVDLLLPFSLATGAAVLSYTERSARLSLWVLALGYLSTGISQLYSLLPWGKYFTFVSMAPPAFSTLWAVVCICYLVYDLLGTSSGSMTRTRKLVLLIVALTVVFVPFWSFRIISDLTDNEVLRLIVGCWSFRVYYFYAILCICILVYEWKTGTSTARVKTASD